MLEIILHSIKGQEKENTRFLVTATKHFLKLYKQSLKRRKKFLLVPPFYFIPFCIKGPFRPFEQIVIR